MAQRDAKMFRFFPHEIVKIKERKKTMGYEAMTFCRWAREFLLGELGDATVASGCYLNHLQATRKRAIDEAMEWRALNELLDLPEQASAGDAADRIRSLLQT